MLSIILEIQDSPGGGLSVNPEETRGCQSTMLSNPPTQNRMNSRQFRSAAEGRGDSSLDPEIIFLTLAHPSG